MPIYKQEVARLVERDEPSFLVTLPPDIGDKLQRPALVLSLRYRHWCPSAQRPFLSQFGFDTLRDLPNREMLEDAGLLSKKNMLAGDIPISEGENLSRDEDEELETPAE